MKIRRDLFRLLLMLFFLLMISSSSSSKENYSFTESDISQIYKLSLNEILTSSQELIVISRDFNEYKYFLHDMFREKEFKVMQECFKNSVTESWPPKKNYFDFSGEIMIVNKAEMDKLIQKKVEIFNKEVSNFATYKHSKEKEIIQFSKIAFNSYSNEAYLFVTYYNSPLDSEMCFCFLQKDNGKWQVTLTFTVWIS